MMVFLYQCSRTVFSTLLKTARRWSIFTLLDRLNGSLLTLAGHSRGQSLKPEFFGGDGLQTLLRGQVLIDPPRSPAKGFLFVAGYRCILGEIVEVRGVALCIQQI